MVSLKNILSEIEQDSQLESEVQRFEDHISSKYKNVLERFMVYYNKAKKCMELSDIYLKREYYGKGFGSKIMEELVKFADKKNLPIILIPESERGSNKKLIDFYKKFGFVVNTGRKSNNILSIPFAKSMFRMPGGK
jgi:GNAT superfamily N-acetyltransferase